MIRTFDQAVKFLENYIPAPSKRHPGDLGLKRMEYLMNLLGNPQFKYPTIHVGGTSGKGSTATIIASILATKYKVGLHTSPHLVDIRERIIIYGSCRESFPTLAPNSRRKLSALKHGGTEVSQKEFIDLLNKVIPTIKAVEKSKFGSPSYFEIVTAMAFLYFYQQKVDIAVIEVGMGGRYDATNVIKPWVAVLTNVGLDHTEILGDTVEKIAEDKVGIIKPGIEVITGVSQSSIIRIIELKCRSRDAESSILDKDFSYQIKSTTDRGSIFDYQGTDLLKDLKLRLLGEYQVENAALAIRAIEKLSNNPIIQLSNDDIKKGLKLAYIPGRLEIVKKKPLVILDGAHNPDKVRALVASIKKIFPNKKITTIIAIKNDKEAKEMVAQLLEISDKVIFTSFQLKGDVGMICSYDSEKLLQIANLIGRQHRYISRHTKVVREMLVVPEAKKALKKASKSAKKDDLILVTGSLYLVGEVRKFLISND